MTLNLKTGLVMQARLGSTRFPGKMLAPFSGEKSILELLILRLKKHFDVNQIVVATTNNPIDNRIEELCEKLEVNCYRGSENDVLQRFIDVGEIYNFETIVRICADNPFLLPEKISELIETFDPTKNDYQSFCFENKIPVIKSHIGLFAEITTLKALKKVAFLTKEQLYREHVTNYIYANKEEFNINFIALSGDLANRNDIRLTVDTEADFKLTQKLYQEINQERFTVNGLINIIDSNAEYREIMTVEIKRNSK